MMPLFSLRTVAFVLLSRFHFHFPTSLQLVSSTSLQLVHFLGKPLELGEAAHFDGNC
jgi:hypothetical protein